MPGAERTRVEGFGKLENGLRQASDWYLWGPYLSERQWGTVREDYSADGDAWSYLPHDHARSRAYRWGEDGMAGFSDVEQQLCLALALWNGRDPILKERMFGLTGAQANHGEDVKEYWWYLDAVPSHSLEPLALPLPAVRLPVRRPHRRERPAGQARPGVRAARHRRLRRGPLLDRRGRLRQGRARPTCSMTVRVTNAGSGRRDAARPADGLVPQHVELGRRRREAAPAGCATTAAIAIDHPFLGDLELLAGPGPDGTAPTALFCENETNDARLYGSTTSPPYPKDGINDHVVAGAATVNPEHHGTKAALWYQVAVEPGRHRRAAPAPAARRRPSRPRRPTRSAPGSTTSSPCAGRRPTSSTPRWRRPRARPTTAMIMRQAFSGMLWSKQLYAYDVRRWLDGDPTQPTPPADRLDEAQLPLEELRRLRHHVDARQVGVPVVRGVGHGLPLRRPGPRRPRLRQVPAGAPVPGVVPAPERRPPRLRVGLRRRQPAGAGVGRARGLRHRRRPRPRLPQPRLRQAARQLHVVGEPRGRRTAPTSSRAASSASTTSARSTARTCPSAASSSSPTPPAGWRFYALAMAGDRRASSPARASGRRPTSSSSSSSTSPTIRRGHGHARACGTTRTACTTTSWSRPTAPSCR